MTNLTNFNRDMSWIDPDISALTMTTLPLCAVDGNVYDKHAYAVCDTAAITEPSTSMFGVVVPAPDVEPIPYRVKADASVNGDGSLVMGFGYTSTVQSGSVTLDYSQFFGFPAGALYDDVWCMRPSLVHVGKPLVIFCGITGASSANVACKIIVQRLIGKPDNFASAVA